MRAAALLSATLLAPLPAASGEADVVGAEIQCPKPRSCNLDVTVAHADAGWSHYADRWEVLDPAGDVIATRVLRHPHVNQQPFTRSLRGVEIPEGIETLRIRARDSHHGYGGAELELRVP